MTGVAPNALSNWETGRQRPSLDQVIRLLPALNVTLDYLFLGDDRGLTWEVREAIMAADATPDAAADDAAPMSTTSANDHAA